MSTKTTGTGMAPTYLTAQQARQIADRMTPAGWLLDEIMRKIEKRVNGGRHSLNLSENDARCPIDFVTTEGKHAWTETKESLMAAGYRVNERNYSVGWSSVTITW